MMCKHERIKSVNCRIFCDICGVELPVDFVPGKDSTTPKQAVETTAEGKETMKKTTRKRKA